MAYFISADRYFSLTHVFGHFPIVMKLVNNMPTWALRIFIPNLTEMSQKQMVRARPVSHRTPSSLSSDSRAIEIVRRKACLPLLVLENTRGVWQATA